MRGCYDNTRSRKKNAVYHKIKESITMKKDGCKAKESNVIESFNEGLLDAMANSKILLR